MHPAKKPQPEHYQQIGGANPLHHRSWRRKKRVKYYDLITKVCHNVSQYARV